MANFINTIELLGDTATAGALVSRTITEFNDDVLTSALNRSFADCNILTSIDLPNVTSIEDYAFFYCDALASVNIPNVTSIGTNAFRHCPPLTNVNMPNVTTIGDDAFRECEALASVNIPNVTSIGSNAFYGAKVASVRLPATPPTLGSTMVFADAISACVFYIPTGSLAAYQNATNWSSLTSEYSFVEEDR